MRKEYDFPDSVRNPYAKDLKKQVTLRLNTDAIAYFKALARKTGIPYQNLIDLYLMECAHSGEKLALKWASKDLPPFSHHRERETAWGKLKDPRPSLDL